MNLGYFMHLQQFKKNMFVITFLYECINNEFGWEWLLLMRDGRMKFCAKDSGKVKTNGW